MKRVLVVAMLCGMALSTSGCGYIICRAFLNAHEQCTTDWKQILIP